MISSQCVVTARIIAGVEGRFTMEPGSDGDVGARKRRPYALRLLLDEVPLTTEDIDVESHITCVEYWSEWLLASYPWTFGTAVN